MKFKVFDKKNIFPSAAKEFDVNIYYYPLNYHFENNVYYFTAAGRLEGDEKNKKKFLKYLEGLKKPAKERRWVASLEIRGDFFITITAHSSSSEIKKFVHIYYDPKFIHVRPSIIHSDGSEEMELASFKKEDFRKVINVGKKLYQFKMIFLKEMKVGEISIVTAVPNLTSKQKNALELAYKEGYYEYPRKTELDKLAELMKISRSTYHTHLRKAEKKLLPFMIQRVLD